MSSTRLAEPPRISEHRAARGFHVLWLAAAGFALLVGARLTESLRIAWPPCGLRTLTSIPCPLCGTTRSLIAWSHLDVGAAIAFNPLVSAAVILGGAWVGLQLLRLCVGLDMSASFGRRLTGKRWPAVAAGLVLANWLYLVINLPP